MLKKISAAIIFSVLTTTAVFANSTLTSVQHFSDVARLIKKAPHPHHTLLVLDDDDTLTMMPCPTKTQCQYLGGPAWFNWQSALPANDPDRIWKTPSQLWAINNLIFSMSKMPLDDAAIPTVLKELKRRVAWIQVMQRNDNSMKTIFYLLLKVMH